MGTKSSAVVAAGLLALTGSTGILADEVLSPQVQAQAPRIDPKPLSANVQRGLAYLAERQLPGGGWGQGDESANIRSGEGNGANVADTCMAALALLRAGSIPTAGAHAQNLCRAVSYVCSEVEAADRDSLFVTSVRGTRVQGKIGNAIDTFLAANLLAEVRNRMADDAANARVTAALDKVLDKIERNQRADGTWEGEGWAPVLSQGMAARAVNRAAQSGAEVPASVRARTEANARGAFDEASGRFAGGPGDAGVGLYGSSASLGAMQESENTNRKREDDLRARLAEAPSAEQAEIQGELGRIEGNRRELRQARASMVEQLKDERFVQGFGSNGGEEFLSYVQIGESLLAAGGEEWRAWDASMTANLERVQNEDGSWTGHHCITGRTFCTSTALLVLMVDRTTEPLSDAVRRR
ncbi:MAG: hypothetical protein HY608_07560 [Planctomycetes bacterium]|nr:hypothetical protein [Planctomycetota bacterium]